MEAQAGKAIAEDQLLLLYVQMERGSEGNQEKFFLYGLHHQESSPQWVVVEEQRWGRKMAIARKGDEQKQREQIPTLI